MLVGLPLELWASIVSENGGLLRLLFVFLRMCHLQLPCVISPESLASIICPL